MKKKGLLVVACILLCISVLTFFVIRSFNKKSYAVGNIYVSPSSLTIEEGSSQAFTIKSENVIGDVSIESSNSGVAYVNTNEWSTGMVGENETKSGTITVTGASVGTATITMMVDGATFDEEDLSGQVRTVEVNVIPKQTHNDNNNDKNENNNSNTNNNTNTNSNNNYVNNSSNNGNSNNNSSQSNSNEEKSDNNKLKDLSVEGYKVKKINDNNYTLDVNRDTNTINIKVVPDDDKATITGAGEKTIKDGDNKFEIVITSESGKTNKVILIVKRINIYELKDLDIALAEKTNDSINIKVDSNSNISSKDLQKIKESGKTVNLLNDDKEKYSFIIDGKSLTNIDSGFSTDITFNSEYESKILELSNNETGEFLHFDQKNKFPEGISLKLYVSDNFSDDDKINVYYYDNQNNKLVEKDKQLEVNDGYIQFKLNNINDHFITTAVIGDKTNNNYLPIILFIGIIILILVIGLLIFKGKKKLGENNSGESLNNSVDNLNTINESVNSIDINNNGLNETNSNYMNNNIEDVNQSAINELNYTNSNEIYNNSSENNIVSDTLDEVKTEELSNSSNNSLDENMTSNNQNNNVIVTNSFDNSNDGILDDIKSVTPENNMISDASNTDVISEGNSEPVITAVKDEYDANKQDDVL